MIKKTIKKFIKKRKALSSLYSLCSRKLKDIKCIPKHLKNKKKYAFKKMNAQRESLINECKGKTINTTGNYFQKSRYSCGVVCDEFLYRTLYSCAELVYISSYNWQETISAIDFLLVVSTWSGLNNHDWSEMHVEGTFQRDQIDNIIKYCKERRIPVAFYSKEDPVNYEKFLDIAKKCDYIFTTAVEVINRYKRDCCTENVYNLNFCVNPEYHNPIDMSVESKKDILFSGAWRPQYSERCSDLCTIFDGVIDSNKSLLIIDRDFKNDFSQFSNYPINYLKYVIKAVNHDTLQKIHKLFCWAININSITDSNTMFANRVYELQACGNLLLSNNSPGINLQFPNVFIVKQKEDVIRALSTFTEAELLERRCAGIRRVMTDETCYDRFSYLCECIGLSYHVQNRSILVVCNDKTPDIEKMFFCQSYSNKTIISQEDLTEDLYKKYDIITWFSPHYYYGPFYLEELINGFKYTDADFITKCAYYYDGQLIAGPEHSFVDSPSGLEKTAFWVEHFRLEEIIQHQFKEKKGYAIDRFGFYYNTQNISIFRHSIIDLTIVINVNNQDAWTFYGKTFYEIRQNPNFDNTHYIFEYDDSINIKSFYMIKHISDMYDNITIKKKEG